MTYLPIRPVVSYRPNHVICSFVPLPVCSCRVIVGGNLVTVRHFQAENVRSVFEKGSSDRTVISFGSTGGAGPNLRSPESVGIFIGQSRVRTGQHECQSHQWAWHRLLLRLKP